MIKYIKSNYGDWVELRSKSVMDSDGFLTDYTLYTDGKHYICVFGDKDVYGPDIDYADYETESKEDAYDWFESYDIDDTEWEMRTDRFDNIESPYYNGDLDDDDFDTTITSVDGVRDYVSKPIVSTFNEFGETKYAVTIGTGTATTYTEEVYAYNEQEALDKVVDRMEESGETGFLTDYYELYDETEFGETVDELADRMNLVVAGNSGWYVEVIDIHEV